MNITTGIHIDKSIVSNYVEVIKETKEEEKPNIHEQIEDTKEETKEERFEQISIFDEIFDDEE